VKSSTKGRGQKYLQILAKKYLSGKNRSRDINMED